MTSFPVGFIIHLGGVVSAKSVKLLDKIHNPGMSRFLLALRQAVKSNVKNMISTQSEKF